MFHRQQIVTCGHAGPAVADDIAWRCITQDAAELRPQLLGRSKGAVGVEILLKEVIRRAWNVSRNLVERFALAAKALRRACVE